MSIAEGMLDGTLCQVCGCFLGAGDGYPATCAGCGGNAQVNTHFSTSGKWAKRADNREKSTGLLQAQAIPFEIHNRGAHLVVSGPTCLIDFWPGTGKYIVRDARGTTGRGVFNLLKHIRKEKP